MYTVPPCVSLTHASTNTKGKERTLSVHTCLHIYVCFFVCAGAYMCECVCFHTRGWGQSSGKPHIPNRGLVTLREKHTLTRTPIHTHARTHTLTHTLKTWPWPDLPTGSPTDRHRGSWETGNRKWALSTFNVEALFIMSCVRNSQCVVKCVKTDLYPY